VSVGEEAYLLYIAPPEEAVFPLKTQLVNVSEGDELYKPPPYEAVFPVNVQLVSVAEESYPLNIPPPTGEEE